VDLGVVLPGCEPVAIPVAVFYERSRALVDQTIRAAERLLSTGGAPLDALYVTGGGSELPLVKQTLREVFGNRARRSPYSRAATAIGLAIQADDKAGYELREKSSSPIRAPESVPSLAIPADLDPEHWLHGLLDDVTVQFWALGGRITFETVSNLLQKRKEAFLKDLDTARRMYRTVSHLSSFVQGEVKRGP
jgi:hypothetical protein